MASSSAMRASAGGGGSNRENTAKAIVADQISQAVQSTSNLLRLIQQSSPSQGQLGKLPKNLLDRTATIRNTGTGFLQCGDLVQVLEQLPRVISSLDEHMESALRSAPHLKTVTQLLAHMENNQLRNLSQIHPPQTGNELEDQPSDAV
ncbi:hypothetical protein MLD38_017218 [Melastoma candidum]|uniref:Uncharacterized protein n=1 Tax=Melastoma candidum TaxID=119954 RepID=A0ACB9QTZ8_9MYRT|nr:hypothetical protein MLD38_017218 [Melastoma candidum]